MKQISIKQNKPLLGVSGLFTKAEFLFIFFIAPFILFLVENFSIWYLVDHGISFSTENRNSTLLWITLIHGYLLFLILGISARKILLSEKRSFSIQKTSTIVIALILSLLLTLLGSNLLIYIFFLKIPNGELINESITGFTSSQILALLLGGFMIINYCVSHNVEFSSFIPEVVTDSTINQMILNLYKEAEKTLIIISPWVKLSGHHFYELEKTLKRNVKTSIVVREVSETINKLQNMGAEILTRKHLHAKMVLIDDSKVLIGSANLIPTSMERNLELGFITNKAEDVQKALNYYKDLKGREENSNDSQLLNQFHLKKKLEEEMYEGRRCLFCKNKKNKDKNRPLCPKCYSELKNRLICSLCGKKLQKEEKVAKTIDFQKYRCNSCHNVVHKECQICGKPKEAPKKGYPLCIVCYEIINDLWEKARYSNIKRYG